LPANSDAEALRRKVEELEKRVTILEREKDISMPALGVSEPKWVRELARPFAIAVEDLGSIVLFGYASKGEHMTIGDSRDKVMDFEPSEITTLLKGLSNPERIGIMKILAESDGKYAQELLEETQLSEGSLHYHLGWLSKSQMVTQEITRGKYKITQLGVIAVSLIGILAYSTTV
jgi:DNA-binding transcriptional ArsR family regulator